MSLVTTATPSTHHPTHHRLPVRRSTEHLAPHGQKRARSGGQPYTPGMFDALIDRPVLGGASRPEQIRSVTVELSASGRSVIVAEHLHSGAGPRHLLTLDEPYSVFMRMTDGREVWIEVRAVEPVATEDREPWGDEPVELELPAAPTLVPAQPAPPAPVCSFACPDFLPR